MKMENIKSNARDNFGLNVNIIFNFIKQNKFAKDNILKALAKINV